MVVVIEDFERCYRFMQSRDPRYDGFFVVAVKSTGVYCRPSCPARLSTRASAPASAATPTPRRAHRPGIGTQAWLGAR
jgi:AraC family transcriptional regulator of adaptative response / DNA-3-methyladenine glycosylase II